jgi:hypothetical protein
LLANPRGGVNVAGLLFALAAGICWGAYILVGAALGRHTTGGKGLALGMVVGALVVVPFGLATSGTALFRPRILAVGLGIALLSSVIPYSFELEALRKLPPRVFGILMSLEPAVAALMGLVVLGKRYRCRSGWRCCASWPHRRAPRAALARKWTADDGGWGRAARRGRRRSADLLRAAADPESTRMAAFPAREVWTDFLAHWRNEDSRQSGQLQADDRMERARRRQHLELVARRAAPGRVLAWPRILGEGESRPPLSGIFSITSTRPLHAFVAAHNVGSIRVLEKCGFVRIGGPTPTPDGVEE